MEGEPSNQAFPRDAYNLAPTGGEVAARLPKTIEPLY